MMKNIFLPIIYDSLKHYQTIMADVNVRSSFFELPEDANKSGVGAHVQKYRPLTSNISNNVVSGDVIFEVNTGFNEYLDLFKTHLIANITIDAGVDLAFCIGDVPLANLFSRAQMYINGVKVASSNNYTQDSMLSKRLMFSKAYNEAINDMKYVAPGSVAAYPAATYAISEFLDGLFLRTPECIIPPNCNVRLVLTVDSDYALKTMIRKTDAAGDVARYKFNDLNLNVYTIVKSDPIPEGWTLKLCTMNSFLSSISGDSDNKQYQVSQNIIKCALTFLSTAYKTTAAAKVYTGSRFTYVDDDDAKMLETLQFKIGNNNIPASIWDFGTYGFRSGYLNYVNESNGIIDHAGKETFADWQLYGKIHIGNVVKSADDKSNSLQCQVKFTAQPAAFMILTSIEENIVVLKYDTKSGAVISTASAQ